MNSIQIINIAKGQLGMVEDDYRAMLVRVTGQASLRQMSERQRIDVLDHMKKMGFRVQSGGKRVPSDVPGYIKKLYAVWLNCHKLGVIEDKSNAALRAFCKRQLARNSPNVVIDPDLLTYVQASIVIETLKKMEARGRKLREGQS
ncbi:MAG: hypothetical protein BGP11_08345 [Rhodobacterales bacterium 65-51]|uniref:regulatory protein GemA n=1 Tax=uncultured Gemmobacter sp. TaxID=1095917 RepID=UPI00095F5B49|nr:regulatory protein GemA [uncultured Gemmobacter sp.]OJY36345.1 MAG: hypothetical protein BGP11_08345 [Rhodobacterales bacterium 65-51]